MRRRIVLVAVALVAMLSLTGCGETLEERIANRDACEAAGGRYVEMVNGFTGKYRDWVCWLDNDWPEGES